MLFLSDTLFFYGCKPVFYQDTSITRIPLSDIIVHRYTRFMNKSMNLLLLDKLFMIEKELAEVAKPEYFICDSGMFLPTGDTEYKYERYITLENTSNEEEYFELKFDLKGNLVGELPSSKAEQLQKVVYKHMEEEPRQLYK